MKIFIVSLPRSGTTSLCECLADMGLRVAHEAYTEQAIRLADVVADVPAFSDYKELHSYFPEAKFIYIDRDVTEWSQSIKRLLPKIIARIEKTPNGFNRLLRHAYERIFGPLELALTADISSIYLSHQERLVAYSQSCNVPLLRLRLGEPDSFNQIAHFVAREDNQEQAFPHRNRSTIVTDWKKLKHPNKVDSYAHGPNRKAYLPYLTLAS